jgi:hypothetical protein
VLWQVLVIAGALSKQFMWCESLLKPGRPPKTFVLLHVVQGDSVLGRVSDGMALSSDSSGTQGLSPACFQTLEVMLCCWWPLSFGRWGVTRCVADLMHFMLECLAYANIRLQFPKVYADTAVVAPASACI